jgi:hypothetical protein
MAAGQAPIYNINININIDIDIKISVTSNGIRFGEGHGGESERAGDQGGVVVIPMARSQFSTSAGQDETGSA